MQLFDTKNYQLEMYMEKLEETEVEFFYFPLKKKRLTWCKLDHRGLPRTLKMILSFPTFTHSQLVTAFRRKLMAIPVQ